MKKIIILLLCMGSYFVQARGVSCPHPIYYHPVSHTVSHPVKNHAVSKPSVAKTVPIKNETVYHSSIKQETMIKTQYVPLCYRPYYSWHYIPSPYIWYHPFFPYYYFNGQTNSFNSGR